MRILHVVTAFPRSPDDVIVPWPVELLKRLLAAGHEVEVFTSSYRGAPDQVVSGIPVHRFRYFLRRWERLTHGEAAPDRMERSLLYRLMPACFVVAGMIAAWRLCRRQRYDVIHVHWPFPLALFGWAAQRARPAALVTTFYGVELRWVKTAMPFFRGFLQWAALRSDRVVAISSYTAAEVRELVQVPIEVIPYTTSLPAPTAVPHAGRRSPGAPFSVLFVGRLVERKGVSHLVDAVSLLLPLPGPDVRLVIVGARPERARAQARHRGRGRVRWVAAARPAGRARAQAAPAAPRPRGSRYGVAAPHEVHPPGFVSDGRVTAARIERDVTRGSTGFEDGHYAQRERVDDDHPSREGQADVRGAIVRADRHAECG